MILQSSCKDKDAHETTTQESLDNQRSSIISVAVLHKVLEFLY